MDSDYQLMSVEKWLYQYACVFVEYNNVDSSHGIDHLTAVHANALKILRADFAAKSPIADLPSNIANDIVLKAAFCHDLIDRKYVDVERAKTCLTWVFRENLYPKTWTDDIIEIIDNMSFSKRIHRRDAGLSMIPQNRLKSAIEIVVDADQLDCYDPDRCYQYNLHKNPNEDPKTIRGYQRTILEKRVLQYRDKFMCTSTGKKMAAILHDDLEEYVQKNLQDAPLFEYNC